MCTQAADAISSLIRSYHELYSLRRIHAFIPYISLVSSTAHLAIAATQGNMTSIVLAKVSQGISDLRNMAHSSVFACRAADALRSMVDSWFPGPEQSSRGAEDHLHRGEGTMYSIRNMPEILAHHAAREKSTVLFYLSRVLAETASGEQPRLGELVRTIEISPGFTSETPHMTEVEALLTELGMSGYLSDFIEQGFDSWDAILGIVESDFEAIGVKLGHRRRLQRKIASWIGLPSSQVLLHSPEAH